MNERTLGREVRFLGINPPALRCFFSSPAAMAAPHALRLLKKLTEEQNQMKARMLIDTKLLFPERLIHEIEHFPTTDLPRNKRKLGDDLKGPLLQKMKTVNAQRLEVRGFVPSSLPPVLTIIAIETSRVGSETSFISG
jgi:hypothetical protein